MKTMGLGFLDKAVSELDARRICQEAFASWNVCGRKVLVVIPDATRSCPLGMMFRLVQEAAGEAGQLDFMVALGTHPAMSMEQIYARVEITGEEPRSK